MAGEQGDFDPQCINCWSGPRCVSTSLMYAWLQRADTQVLDEPLYAHYLKLTGAERPYRDLVLQAQSTDAAHVVSHQLLGPRERGVLYAKHMAKHAVGVSDSLFRRAAHVLLVREPSAVIRSFSEVLEPTLGETCYPALCELYSRLRSYGRPPPVILSDDLLQRPEATLRTLCGALGLPFEASMLSWRAGPKPCDGVWAPWWYSNTHESTGFSAPAANGQHPPLDDALKPLLEEARPLYEWLRRRALRPEPEAPPVPRPPRPPAGGGKNGVAARRGGTHVYEGDSRNADVLIGMRDGVHGTFSLVWRPEARVSCFDSGFMLGDGVWEGIRLHKGCLVFAEAHFERLYEGAKALDMDIGLTPDELQALVYQTVDGNGMSAASHVHIRLMVTRGLKPTPYQNPNITIGLPTVVVAPEYKKAAPGPKEEGITLFTVHVRRGAADVQDPAWNSHSKLNCIAACIQANHAGVDEALMLDPHGFVATCNSTNFFIVRKGEVWAPTTKYQLHGITRDNVLRLCAANGIPVREADFSLTSVYSADEAFVTGTFAGVLPVRAVDGRTVGSGTRGPLTAKLQMAYGRLVDMYVVGRRRELGGGA